MKRLVIINAKRGAAENPTHEFRVKTNRQFHDAILAAARNGRLADAVYKAGQFYFNHRVARQTVGKDMQADHDRIIEALQARDGAAAEAATRAHILRAFEVMYQVGEL